MVTIQSLVNTAHTRINKITLKTKKTTQNQKNKQ